MGVDAGPGGESRCRSASVIGLQRIERFRWDSCSRIAAVRKLFRMVPMLLQVVIQLSAEIYVGSLLLLDGCCCLASLLVRTYDRHGMHKVQSCIGHITPQTFLFNNKWAGQGRNEARSCVFVVIRHNFVCLIILAMKLVLVGLFYCGVAFQRDLAVVAVACTQGAPMIAAH